MTSYRWRSRTCFFQSTGSHVPVNHNPISHVATASMILPVVQYMYRCTYLLSLIDIHAHARTLRIQMSFNFLQTRTGFSETPWVGVTNLCIIRSNRHLEFACRICMHDARARALLSNYYLNPTVSNRHPCTCAHFQNSDELQSCTCADFLYVNP